MENKIVSYETALLAKEIGFDWECNYVYRESRQKEKLEYYEGDGTGYIINSDVQNTSTGDVYLCTAPTQPLLQKYLREKHLLHINIYGFVNSDDQTRQYYYCIRNMEKYWDLTYDSETFDTYEECLEDALQQCLNSIKNNI